MERQLNREQIREFEAHLLCEERSAANRHRGKISVVAIFFSSGGVKYRKSELQDLKPP